MNLARLARTAQLVVLELALSGSVAAAADEAKGTFRFGKVQVQVADALAYLQDGKDPARPVAVVVLADFRIDRPAVLAAIDTVGGLMQQVVKKGSGNVVFVKWTSPEQCGLSAYLGEGSQSITLSDTFPAKWKAAGAPRITGECFTSMPGKMFDDVYEFRLSYDLPVTVIPKPSALPAGGGAPGAALVALVGAIRTANWSVARLHLREDEVPATPPRPSELKNYFDGLALNYPKTAVVTGGLTKGDLAQVEIRGTDNEGKKVKGTFAMKRVAGAWRVVEWSMFFAE